MQWDFWTFNPESVHQVTYLMGDRGIPRTYRHMNGYGSHTYMWVNASGERCWVKYYLHSQQGVEGLSGDEATRIAGEDADFHRRELLESIEKGDHPRWTLSVQVIPFEEGFSYKTNIFDVTKTVSHADYPLHEVGVMTLDRKPDSHFAQIEQAAFEPSATVPGIGPNYLQLPVNRHRVEGHSDTYDGPMAYDHAGDAAMYAANTQGTPYSDGTGPAEDSYPVSGHLLGGVTGEVLQRAFDYWKAVDAETGARIERAVRAGQAEDNPGGQPEDAKDDAARVTTDADGTRRG